MSSATCKSPPTNKSLTKVPIPVNVDTPVTPKLPPILTLFSIPTPPSTIRAPESFVAESVVSSTKTATPLRYAQSAPVGEDTSTLYFDHPHHILFLNLYYHQKLKMCHQV